MIKPLKNNIILLPNVSKTFGSIIIPETHYTSGASKVLAVGPDSHPSIKPGMVVMTMTNFSDKQNRVIDEESKAFLCKATEVFAVVLRGKLYPLNRKVLIKREIGERYKGELVIPEAQSTTDQSLYGTVIGFGLLRSQDFFRVSGIKIGNRIRLKKWEAHITEVGWGDDYCLIVNEEDIVCSE